METLLNDFISDVNDRSEEAFKQLYDAFYRELVYFSTKMNNSLQDSEDIVHDTILSIWESDYKFENIKYLKSFLHTSVRNRTLNFMKREGRLTNDFSSIDKKLREERIESDIIETEVISILNMAISELPSECKKIMTLLINGYSCSEIAIIKNLASSTVRAQKKRGLSLLKNKLPKDILLLLYTMV